MFYYKITEGYVIQTFDDAGECIDQEFKIGDHNSTYELADGTPINAADMPKKGKEYQPFDMVQPKN